MENLGTLWFGADIDLARLQQKIQQGNQGVLNALKINYDTTSYQDMVNRLRTALGNERFEVKISTNMASAVQGVRDRLNQVGKGAIPTVSMGNLQGVAAMTSEILKQRAAILDVNRTIVDLKNNWLKMRQIYGTNSQQARSAHAEWQQARAFAKEYGFELRQMSIDRQRAALQQRELNKQMREGAAAAKQQASDHLRLNTTLANGIHISTQLGSALSSLFAIDAARQFLGNVIEIGGQLEKQRISIAAILGDTAKANTLFEQIKGLALKSPFGVVELDQYTKQLSAYGFKYNELFDMTKRLADISAGAGQDIGRLTLALGHVRSATYLTGITLRQFSMNNIPMLKMLAEYYSEVENKAVSTADVQKRISKRQVSYEDVIEQFRRLTNEGGMFYNMQEKISESLAAKYKNLRDAFDIMYGEMAEGNVGDALKSLAEGLLTATRHWREIASVMSVAMAAFVIGKLRIGASNIALQGNTAATLKNIMATKQLAASKLQAEATYRKLTAQERIAIASSNSLTAADIRQAMATGQLNKSDVLRLVALKRLKIAQAMHLAGINGITAAEIRAAAAAKGWRVAAAGLGMSLKNAFRGIGPRTWVTLGAMAGMELYSAWSNWVDRIDEKAEEMKDNLKSRITDLDKERKLIREEGKPTDTTALKNRVQEMKQVLANSEAYTKTLDEQLSKTTDINQQYDILVQAIETAAEKSQRALDYTDRAAELVKASKSDFKWTDVLTANVWNQSGRNIWNQLFNEDIETNIGDVNDAYKQLRQTLESLYEYKEPLREMINDMAKSGEVSKETAEALKDAPLEEQLRILVQNGYWDKIQEKIMTTGKYFSNTEKEIEKDCENLKKSLKNVADNWMEIADDDVPRMLAKLRENFDGDEKKMREWALNNIDDFRLMMDGVLDQIGEKQPHIRRKLKEMVFDYISFGKMTDGSVTLEQEARAAADTMAFINKIWKSQREEFLREEKLADLKDDTPKSGGDTNNGSKKDHQLEAAKTKLQQYKAFLSEYKKYREIYSKEKAIDILATLFPDLKDEKGNFLGNQLIDNYDEILKKLRSSISGTTEARKKFQNEIDKTQADTALDRQKELLKKNADATKEYLAKMQDQWKRYNSLMQKSGGNRQLASLAFTDGMIWDEMAKKMREEFNRLGNERGVLPISFRWDMNEEELKESLRDAKGELQGDLVDTAKKIQEIIRGNYQKFLEESAEAYSKSLSAAEKLAELERKRTEIIQERDTKNTLSDAEKKGYDAQIAYLDKQIADAQWNSFKETEEWGRIFTNLDKISSDTLQNMRNQLRQLAPTVSESVEATKALYEAIDKIDKTMLERNPFKAMADALRMASVYQNAINFAKTKFPGIKGGDTIGFDATTAKRLGLTDGTKGWSGTLNQLRDNLQAASSDFANSINGIADKFKDVQDVLQPVIDLLQQLGNTSIADFFQIGSNALGSAAGVASGISSISDLFNKDSGIGKLLGKAGPYAAAAAAGLSIVTSLFALHDKSLQKEIEASQARQKEMENLSKNLEAVLSRTLGGVYYTKASNSMIAALRREITAIPLFGRNAAYKSYISRDTIKAVEEAEKTKTYYDAAYASMLAQRDEVAHQMESEREKKDSDSNKIADYKQQLIEMDDEIKHFAEDMAKAIYDIDVKSWAKELTDTIVEAWKKGENAVDAYKSKVKEMMLDLTTNILSQKVMEKALSDIGIDKLISNLMTRTKGQLDENSVAQIAEALNKAGEMSATTITAVLDEMERKGYVSKGEGASKEGSISNTIKGMSEQVGNLIYSIINAIRADVSVNRMLISDNMPLITVAVQRTNVIAEQQVAQLQAIADNTRRNADAADRIYELLHRVTPDGQRILVK